MIENICDDCGICCLETEMIISLEDIENILKHSQNTLKKEDFSLVNDEGFFQLKNSNGKCVFFNSISKRCNIYEIRPEGCRFYPLVYSSDSRSCVVDEDCPRNDIYFHNKKQQQKICKSLKKFLKEKLFVKL
ncbi:MAG: YkgJ family cysteine cluster protein [Promethearchaeota archaeon]